MMHSNIKQIAMLGQFLRNPRNLDFSRIGQEQVRRTTLLL